MGIVRPVMEVHPLAWAFSVPFIVVTRFTVLKLFIALIVNSMQTIQAHSEERVEAEARVAHAEREALSRQLGEFAAEVRALRDTLRRSRARARPSGSSPPAREPRYRQLRMFAARKRT